MEITAFKITGNRRRIELYLEANAFALAIPVTNVIRGEKVCWHNLHTLISRRREYSKCAEIYIRLAYEHSRTACFFCLSLRALMAAERRNKIAAEAMTASAFVVSPLDYGDPTYDPAAHLLGAWFIDSAFRRIEFRSP